ISSVWYCGPAPRAFGSSGAPYRLWTGGLLRVRFFHWRCAVRNAAVRRMTGGGVVRQSEQARQDLARVLAEPRRRDVVRDRSFGISYRARDARYPCTVRADRLHLHSARHHLRIGEHLVDRRYRPAGHRLRLQQVDPLARAAPGHRFGDQRDERVAVLHPATVGDEPAVGGEVVEAGYPAECGELSVIADGEDHVPVGGREYLVGHDVGVRVAEPPG